MSDQIIIKPKSEPGPATDSPEQEESKNPSSITQLTNLCALGLGMSFFLPWMQLFGVTVSGFDLQKHSEEYLILWLIPIFCAITIVSSVTGRSQKSAGQLTGFLPFCVALYGYYKLQNDLFELLTYGGFLSLGFGAALLILPLKPKQS